MDFIKSRYIVFVVILFLLCQSCQENKVDQVVEKELTGDYFGLRGSDTAEIFAEGIVSQQYQELNAVFSPDGNEFYYTLADPGRNFYTIMNYKRGEDGIWTGPEVASFSGRYADADPYITADGKELYFISRRPVDQTSTDSKDFDIWKVVREDDGWSEAIRLDTLINTPQNEYYVSVTTEGSIFYSAQYEGGEGYGDIYEARPSDGSYVISNLGPNVNSPTGEGDPYVSPDGDLLIFMSWGREDDLGRGDLYISRKIDGEWQPAKNLGPEINSPAFEYCPMMSPDGKYFFWTSYKSSPYDAVTPYDYQSYLQRIDGIDNGLGNIYWIDGSALDAH